MPDPITLVDKRPDQCQRCGTLGADGNPAGLDVTHWRCGRCNNVWTTDESVPVKRVEIHENESPHETFKKLRQLAVDIQADRDQIIQRITALETAQAKMRARVERVEQAVVAASSMLPKGAYGDAVEILKSISYAIRNNLGEIDQ